MPLINLIGSISHASGSAIHLSLAGPNHYSLSRTFTGSFSENVDLAPGIYEIFLSVYTDGNFKFDADGNYQSIDPVLPDQYASKNKEHYLLTI